MKLLKKEGLNASETLLILQHDFFRSSVQIAEWPQLPKVNDHGGMDNNEKGIINLLTAQQ